MEFPAAGVVVESIPPPRSPGREHPPARTRLLQLKIRTATRGESAPSTHREIESACLEQGEHNYPARSQHAALRGESVTPARAESATLPRGRATTPRGETMRPRAGRARLSSAGDYPARMERDPRLLCVGERQSPCAGSRALHACRRRALPARASCALPERESCALSAWMSLALFPQAESRQVPQRVAPECVASDAASRYPLPLDLASLSSPAQVMRDSSAQCAERVCASETPARRDSATLEILQLDRSILYARI